MDKQKETAGMTATKQTKWGWGLVALVSVTVFCTCTGSLWLTLGSAALFAFSAWRGGYMTEDAGRETSGHATNQLEGGAL